MRVLATEHQFGVMPGLDPGIHEAFAVVPTLHAERVMDCRVQPGNDADETALRPTANWR